MISRSASRMLLRMLANVLPRQSVSPAISRSIRSDGSMGSPSRLRGVGRAAGGLDAEALKRSEEHTSELQSQSNLVCRLLLEKKKNHKSIAARLSSVRHPTAQPSATIKR